MPDQPKQTKPDFRPNYRSETQAVMGIVFELGFIIALPLVLLAELGKWLDNKTGHHYFIYIGIVLALSLTALWFYKRFSEMLERLRIAAKVNKSLNKSEEQNSQDSPDPKER